MLALILALGACGGEDDPTASQEAEDEGSPLEQTAARLRELRSGTMDLRLEASERGASSGEVVGFAVSGSFGVGEAGALPVADLTYTQLVGTEELTSRLLSTEDGAYVELDGVAYELPDEAAASLEMPSDGGDSPIGGLRLVDWFMKPTTVQAEVDGTRVDRVSGRADVAVVLADLFATSSGFSTEPLAIDGDLNKEEVAALERAVRSSSVELLSDADDHDLRSLDVDIEIGTEFGIEDLDTAFERLAGLRIHFALSLTDHGAEIDVQAPRDAKPASDLPR